jgi:exocyst complex protein 7
MSAAQHLLSSRILDSHAGRCRNRHHRGRASCNIPCSTEIKRDYKQEVGGKEARVKSGSRNDQHRDASKNGRDARLTVTLLPGRQPSGGDAMVLTPSGSFSSVPMSAHQTHHHVSPLTPTAPHSAALNDTEQALAEVELLAQNQKKLGTLTNRMTTILSGFDRRLIKLESTMLPIHRSTQTLLRIQDNIDHVLESLNKTLGHYDVLQDEEPLVMQGPSTRNPQPYLDTIGRVKQGLDFLVQSNLQSQQKVMLKMNDLIETGSRNIADLIKDWLTAETDQHSMELEENLSREVPLHRLSSATIDAIVPLFSFLKTLPTHPKTHHAPFSSALVAYSDIRGNHMENALVRLAQRVLTYSQERLESSAGRSGMTAAWQNDDEEAGYTRGSAGISIWINSTLSMAENELLMLTELLQSLSPPSSSTTIQSTFARLLRLPLRSFANTLNTLHNEVRRRATSMHNFFAFDIIGTLTNASHQWESIIVANCPKQESHHHHESTPLHALTESLAAFRNTAMQVFPTFIQQVNSMPLQRETEVPSTAVNEITYSSLTYMRHICEYADVVGPLLATLGSGNWLMGAGGAPVLSLDIDQESILSQYLCDVLAALLNALEARSRAIRQQSTASIFLFNNIGHIRREIARSDQESTSSLAACLGTTASELIDGALRQANGSYLDAWNPVVSALMEDGMGLNAKSGSKITAMGGGGERAAVKDRFA